MMAKQGLKTLSDIATNVFFVLKVDVLGLFFSYIGNAGDFQNILVNCLKISLEHLRQSKKFSISP